MEKALQVAIQDRAVYSVGESAHPEAFAIPSGGSEGFETGG